MGLLQGKEDIWAEGRRKFWNTYQLSNFSLVPVHLRTAYTGLCGFIWAAFLCYSQQSGDGTMQSALLSLRGDTDETEKASRGK